MADVVAVSQSDFNLLREYKKHPSTELVERYNRVLPVVESFLERLLDPLTALCLREF